MSNKVAVLICAMLAVIIGMQWMILSRLDRNYEKMGLNDQFICQRIDVLQGHVYEVLDILRGMSGEEGT